MKRGTPRHRKMRKLATLLNVPLCQAVGMMEMLWHWAGQETPQGDLGTATDKEIAQAADWSRKPEQFVTALVEAGWVDRHPEYRLVIHDWKHHADQAVRKWLIRRRQDFLPLYNESADASPDASPDAVRTQSIHTRAELSGLGNSDSLPRTTENQKPPTSRRNAITDEQWCEFRGSAPGSGVDGSPEDWRKAEMFGWAPLDPQQRQAAIEGLGRDHIGKMGCLPQNYLQSRMWLRPVRGALPPSANKTEKTLQILKRRMGEEHA